MIQKHFENTTIVLPTLLLKLLILKYTFISEDFFP